MTGPQQRSVGRRAVDGAGADVDYLDARHPQIVRTKVGEGQAARRVYESPRGEFECGFVQ